MFQSLIYSYLRRCPIDYGKGFVRKLARLPKGAEKIAFTSPDGIRYKLDLTNHVMREIFIFGQYEKNTARLLSRMAKEDSVYCDVGANIGAYVLPLSRKITKGKIFAFEPNPRALVILNENLSLNNAAGVEVIPCGLSDKKETLTLFTPSLTTASVHKNKDSGEKEIIQLITLDEFCDSRGIRSIDLMKIDIEGHEMQCLQGGLNVIQRSKNLVLSVEIDDNCLAGGYSKQSLFDFVVSLGFRAYAPRGFPFRMREIRAIPDNYTDNVIFIKK